MKLNSVTIFSLFKAIESQIATIKESPKSRAEDADKSVDPGRSQTVEEIGRSPIGVTIQHDGTLKLGQKGAVSDHTTPNISGINIINTEILNTRM